MTPNTTGNPLIQLVDRAADKGYAAVISRTREHGWRISLIVPTEGVHMSDRVATGDDVESAAQNLLANIDSYPDLF
jgi:hypothetical protein